MTAIINVKQRGELMAEVNPEDVKAAEDKLRDIINWVEVFETEYKLDKEIVDTLRAKLEEAAVLVGNIGK